ncbi:lycopene cyclase domain-containing protein [Mucilaginibacter sp. E4BP6]|uniref:lycopene cyclase domain-containing protein n=1 Tax=Mucilaginibacter sp. E4BP6 TaxID=2723089 RepID=UPI0015CE6BE5|nr:lycopene cyclase domain-containing protein [Mucilaginibacter sp. E4BP6]NYE68596.1 lycopene cyclase domain-containing protein [Mucilaginibacter sp. E4BP6]
MKFTYLLIDLFSVLVPLLFSFHPGLKFYKSWPALFPAMLLTATIFLAWDSYFTHLRIWGFNKAYLTGIDIGNLPLEEVLFFICIPYACLFTYASLSLMVRKNLSKRAQLVISLALVIASVLMLLVFHSLYYTSSAFALLAVLLITAQFFLKVSWLSRFYTTYLVLLLPFLIVNGLLTGTGLAKPVVWYNSAHIMGLRVLSIPLEDVFYGMDLILLNVMIFTGLKTLIFNRHKTRQKLTTA